MFHDEIATRISFLSRTKHILFARVMGVFEEGISFCAGILDRSRNGGPSLYTVTHGSFRTKKDTVITVDLFSYMMYT